jgi:two-component system chemotaxis sensor kinase CheA
MDIFNDIHSLGTFFDTYTDISGISGLGDSIEAELTCAILFSSLMENDLLRDALGLEQHQVQAVSKDFMRSWLATQPVLEPRKATPPAPAPAAQPAPVPASSTAPAASAPTAPAATSPIPTAIEVPPPPAAQLPPAEHTAPATGRTQRSRVDDTVRISVSLLDDLMNLAGEMVLGRNQLLRLGEGVSREVPGLPGVLQSINRVTSALQGRVMRTRLQPVSGLFGKFPRVVRDLANKLGKEIDLELSGEDVELDRTLLEGISDPLTHLVRNSADHGIEMPEQRQAAGKHRTGKLRISAAHVGGRVQIEVTDDGRGLDPAKLKQKAAEKGLIRPADAEQMGVRQAQSLIFLPGFSTAAQVSDISGRGVGMDVVKTNIEKLGGHVELESEPGHGLRVIVRLPLTLAIVPALLVGEGSRRFAVPQVNLEEIVRIDDRRRIEIVRNSWVLRLRERLLPVGSLSAVLSNTPPPPKPPTRGYVLVLKVENHRYGLLVERVLDSEEIVVKPLGQFVKTARLFSGATILGDGRVALIIDSTGVADAAGISFLDTHSTATEHGSTEEIQSLLLFRSGGRETLAMHLASVGRIERLSTNRIDRVGDQEFMRYGESSLRLLRLHHLLPIAAPPPDSETLFVIVPKLVRYPMGLIAHTILDAVHVPVQLDNRTIVAPGLLGSAMVNNALTLLVDVYRLLDLVEPGSGKEAGSPTLSGKRILYAEDTAFFRTVVGNHLRSLGVELELASDGLEAWELLQSRNYDALLTDIEMPRMGGFDLARRVRSNQRLGHLPIVALSARGNDSFLEEGRAAGITHYETKLDKLRLQNALTSVLTSRSHLQAIS